MRTKREDWLDAGFALLREGGAERLTIERLCETLSRTKGSFYHHYDDIQAFRAALLEAWAERHTQAPIDSADAESASSSFDSAPPSHPSTGVRGRASAQRRNALHHAVAKIDQRLELAIRAWSDRDSLAHTACQAVDVRRVEYLRELWMQEGKPKALAGQIAEIEYAAFLGLLARYGPEYRKHKATYALLVRALGAVTA